MQFTDEEVESEHDSEEEVEIKATKSTKITKSKKKIEKAIEEPAFHFDFDDGEVICCC